MLASCLRAEDETAGALLALGVSSPTQISTAMIVSGLPCIASPALSIITATNHYIFSRYSYDPSIEIVMN